ncbi:uncharacterized protein C9orf50 homolog, partial [Perognathus longimembris pacificus]|uniref:uncharacterized protein C9orf50 homolog n=1 Tax=Perognathus longimembris pacificus TaxID=214514 RepID=UPI00201A16DD
HLGGAGGGDRQEDEALPRTGPPAKRSKTHKIFRDLAPKSRHAQTRGHGGVHAGSRSPQCPTCPFLPELWHHPTHFHHLPPGHPHPPPGPGPRRGDRWKLTASTANPLSSSQVPRIKTVLIHSPREGTVPRRSRRCCPFRVRFADETLRDSERRYWERSCAVHRNVFEEEPTTLPEGSVPERVLRNVGKWLESLPKAVYPRLKEAMSSSSYWERTGVPPQEPQRPFSSASNASLRTRLPFIARASTPKPRGDYKAFLDAYGTLDHGSPLPCSCSHKREPFLPSLVLQSVLKRSRP